MRGKRFTLARGMRPVPGGAPEYNALPAPATTAEEVQRYKIESHVVYADEYGAAPHTGRGG
jgi:hypothetical protein